MTAALELRRVPPFVYAGGTHALDTDHHLITDTREWLEDRGLERPSDAAVHAALTSSTDAWADALRAQRGTP